ncbi:hypothetical protein PVAND_010142 [Polypedilum vanderplanki]|uniref:ABC transporter domain-containing protein n=1 Tax=Polypedilum vanderplanki TaxID=319348 RepID=A0A9J6CFR7_POLVA|nr:hypothetical protein PVAND_010142 [Polypedilum vanderplanki]
MNIRVSEGSRMDHKLNRLRRKIMKAEKFLFVSTLDHIMNSVEVRDAFISYHNESTKQKFILNGLNMTVAPSSIYALIGASGCGKTTLLSCILGMKELDSGTIKVLGHKVTSKKQNKVARSIGFMPQDIALSPQLTIGETLKYFGNIFLMSEQKLEERSHMIKELLELPPDDRLIENLSGGQRRRVSLAAAIIHNPQILILDEPTVGVDSILRDKIWKFLIKSTRESNLSIIITTHYISEAQQSDRCGMMRDGVLLAEDSPRNILLKYEADSLDEAFLNLCKLNKQVLPNSQNPIEVVCDGYVKNDIGAGQEKIDELSHFKGKLLYYIQIISALFSKEWACFKRGKMDLLSNLLYLTFLSIMLMFGPGSDPRGLKIGIVNKEVLDPSYCKDYLRQNISYRNEFNDCIYEHLSCHFLNEIQDEDFIKVHYNNFNDSYKDAKQGKLIAVLEIQRNFSEALQYLHENFNANGIEFSQVGVHLDQTDMQISTFVHNRLMKAYFKFAEKVMVGCKYNKDFVKPPLNISPMFGSLYKSFKKSILPLFILQGAYFQSFGSSCYRISQSKVDGIWNRTLLAGVNPIEILIVQFIFSIVIMFVSFLSGILVLFLSIGITDFTTIFVSFILGISFCTAGIFMSVLLSSVTKNASFITAFIFGGSILAVTTSGLFWPVDGQPEWLQQISYFLPFAYTSDSLRDIVMKGSTFLDFNVIKGFVNIFFWIIATFLLSFLVMKKKKFS